MDDFLKSFYSVVTGRRSVRKFKPDGVPVEKLDRIVEAGLWAPSALNMQPWFFHVLTGAHRDEFAILCRGIWDKLKPAIDKRYGEEGVKLREPFYRDLGGAPVVIAIFADRDAGEDYAWVSCAMAAQNMLLAATAEGLGSLYMAAQLLIKDEATEFFAEDRRLIGCLLVGYADDGGILWPRRDRRVNWGEIHSDDGHPGWH